MILWSIYIFREIEKWGYFFFLPFLALFTKKYQKQAQVIGERMRY